MIYGNRKGKVISDDDFDKLMTMRLVERYFGEMQTLLYFSFMFKVKLAFTQIDEDFEEPEQVMDKAK